jgi:hypothetical protein
MAAYGLPFMELAQHLGFRLEADADPATARLRLDLVN